MRKRFIGVLTVIFLLGTMVLSPLTVKAAAVSGTNNQNYLFFYSGGGSCTITVEASYSEIYTTNGTYNYYNERRKGILIQRTYSGDMPYVYSGNVKHSNNTWFQSWTMLSIMYPAEWDTGSAYANYQSATYSMTSNITGTFYYTVNCDSAFNPSVAESITIQL